MDEFIVMMMLMMMIQNLQDYDMLNFNLKYFIIQISDFLVIAAFKP